MELEPEEEGLPVLDPPPGFEDSYPIGTEDHYYDDPYNDEEELKPTLSFQAISQFAGELACSLLASIIAKPTVKLRTKKPPVVSICDPLSQCDVYSLPVDHVGRIETKVFHNRHSIAVPKAEPSEPVHMTLEEVRSYLREFQDTASSRRRPWMIVPSKSVESSTSESKRKSCFVWTPHVVSKANSFDDARTKRSRKSLSVTAAGIKQALFSVFRLSSHHHLPHQHGESSQTGWTFSMPDQRQYSNSSSPHQRRALPPLPQEDDVGFVRVPSRPSPDIPQLDEENAHQFATIDGNCLEANPAFETPELSETTSVDRKILDFAASIEAVKDHGWYWGPLSGEAAERILSNEPDGSFLVRDSSDDHYIFSLSFKLNGGVRHVRIEHDHGNFSFGSVARFRSQTMVEFIDKAIEHSRSGRFLFFLHRRPTHGPTRVQLLHPVSRFRQVQSLQHLSRFIILKFVRRDQIPLLPLPARLRDYLNTAHYYAEQLQGSLPHSS